MCLERGKTWEGDNPTCYFDNPERNWNCATINTIRDLVYEGQDLPPKINYQYCGDPKYATININDVEDDNGNWIGRCLYVQWYKNRGNTEDLLILGDDKPRHPTERECIAIINAFK
jgi:hypothetical protein